MSDSFATPGTVSPPGFSAHGIFQARIRSRLPFPSPGDLPDPGIEPVSLAVSALAGGFFTASAAWEALRKACSDIFLQILVNLKEKYRAE